MVLIISVSAVAIVGAWPGILTATQEQRSDDYWAAAMPFSVTFHSMKPDTMALAVINRDPTTLTITEIWLDGVKVDFFNHSVPYTSTANARCSGGVCSIAMAPGVMQIISTGNITTSPSNPCGYGSGFQYGAKYSMDLVITYHGLNSNNTYNQTSPVKLEGTCSGWGGCEIANCCGILNAQCCAGGSCNESGLACDGSLCVPCGGAEQPCCSGTDCSANLVCTGSSPPRCVCGSAAGQPCCDGTTCTGASGLVCNSTTHLCQSCGDGGETCCSGDSCTGAMTICNTSTSFCTTCGSAAGQFCCAGNDCSGGANLTCNTTSTLCESCGGVGELCCGGTTCDSGNRCSSGVCELICGGSGEACCPPNNTCGSSSLGCDYNTMTCQTCGSQGQPCCAGTSPYQFECPASIYYGCDISTHTCVTGCGIATAPCCGTAHTCTQGAGPMICNPAEDLCYRCGQYGGDPCCTDTPWNYCEVTNNLGCNHNTDVCVSCGAQNGPCCGSSHYCPYFYNVCNSSSDTCDTHV